MKMYLAVIAFLLSASVQAANVAPDAVCSDGEDCATKFLLINGQESIDDEDDCSVDGRSCHEFLIPFFIESIEDCKDKSSIAQDECTRW